MKVRTWALEDHLEGAGRLETVASMLGGRATGASRKHAQELLESSLT
jgi:DNA repair ATPase RecN